jgi:hypothetical protein
MKIHFDNSTPYTILGEGLWRPGKIASRKKRDSSIVRAGFCSMRLKGILERFERKEILGA